MISSENVCLGLIITSESIKWLKTTKIMSIGLIIRLFIHYQRIKLPSILVTIQTITNRYDCRNFNMDYLSGNFHLIAIQVML